MATITTTNITECVNKSPVRNGCEYLSEVYVPPFVYEPKFQEYDEDVVTSLDKILTLKTNYDPKQVEQCVSKLLQYLSNYTRMGDMGVVQYLSTAECLVDRYRGGGKMFPDVFYSMIPGTMYRAMNMDEIATTNRLRTYSGRGNVIVDSRLYPFDNLRQTTGAAFVLQDLLDTRWGCRSVGTPIGEINIK